VRDVAELEQALANERPDIGVIVVPGDQAQTVADRLVRGGVKAILNFAPAPLQVPEDVSLKNVNLALELEALSFALASQRH
jgi:redox-sensing transcriptional repressor